VLRQAYHPDGFNIGINVGRPPAPALPNTSTFTSSALERRHKLMPIVGETRVIPETLGQTYARLRPLFDEKPVFC